MITKLSDNFQDAKDGHPSQIGAKVCMHVLASVRTDARVLREAQTLIREGYTVSIVDIEGEYNCPVEEVIQEIRVKHVITPEWFRYNWHFDLRFLVIAAWMFFRSVIRLVQTQTDIYHAHDEKALPACYIAAFLRRKPLIFDAHELPLATTTARWRGLTRITAFLLSIIIPHCAGVITVSSPIAQEISKRYHHPKVLLIRNIPPYKLVPRSDCLRRKLGLEPEVMIALYQGNIQPDRRLDVLVRAAAFLERNIVIVLMGKGVGSIPDELEALARQEGVADRVKILPAVPYEELLEWTSSADIGLTIFQPDYSLSIRFSLPNKFFEYLMAGVPVLSTSLDAVVDMIERYEVGKVVPSPAPEDIGVTISGMLADRDALATMRHNALEAVQCDLCWEKESLQLVQLYKDILATRGKVSYERKTLSDSTPIP